MSYPYFVKFYETYVFLFKYDGILSLSGEVSRGFFPGVIFLEGIFCDWYFSRGLSLGGGGSNFLYGYFPGVQSRKWVNGIPPGISSSSTFLQCWIRNVDRGGRKQTKSTQPTLKWGRKREARVAVPLFFPWLHFFERFIS